MISVCIWWTLKLIDTQTQLELKLLQVRWAKEKEFMPDMCLRWWRFVSSLVPTFFELIQKHVEFQVRWLQFQTRQVELGIQSKKGRNQSSTILGTCKGPKLGFTLAHQTCRNELDLKLLCVAGPPVSKLWLLVDLILVDCAKFRNRSKMHANMRFGDTLPQDVRLKLQAPIQIIKEG